MKTEDNSITRRRLLNYWAIFQSGGIDSVVDEIKVESYLYGERAFFVRIADKNNKTLFLKYPENWISFNIEQLETLSLNDFSHPVTLSSKIAEFQLEVSSVKLSDAYILQIGMSTARRIFFLRIYRRNFIFILGLLIVFSIGAGLFFGGRALKPLRDLNATLKKLLIPEISPDEWKAERSVMISKR